MHISLFTTVIMMFTEQLRKYLKIKIRLAGLPSCSIISGFCRLVMNCFLSFYFQGQEWKEKKGRTRKQKATKTEQDADLPDSKAEESVKEPEAGDYQADRFDRGGSVPRGRRNDRAPPRFQKGSTQCQLCSRMHLSLNYCCVIMDVLWCLQQLQAEAGTKTIEETASRGIEGVVEAGHREAEVAAVDRLDQGAFVSQAFLIYFSFISYLKIRVKLLKTIDNSPYFYVGEISQRTKAILATGRTSTA